MTKKSKSRRRHNHRRKAREDVAVSTVTKQDEQLELEAMMQRLKLNRNVGISITASAEDDLLEEAIKLAAAEKKEIEALEANTNCTHRYELDEYIERFDQAFHKAMIEAVDCGHSGLDQLDIAHKATASQFADVWNDSTQIAKAVNNFAAIGTAYLLEGNMENAIAYASLTSYFEQFAKVVIDRTQAHMDVNKLLEINSGDDHTIVSFFKKRIPCLCLNEIYKEVKSIKKKGVCWNRDCKYSIQDSWDNSELLDRSSLMSCSRCHNVYYCSVECQKADWSKHKSDCDEAVARKIAFDEAKCYRAT